MDSRADVLRKRARKLQDEGDLMEAGWLSYVLVCGAQDASEEQLRNARITFFAGAQYAFAMTTDIVVRSSVPDRNRRFERIGKEMYQFYLTHLKGKKLKTSLW